MSDTATARTAGSSRDPLLPAGLVRHWQAWLGADPDDLAALGDPAGAGRGVHVVGSAGRERPGWDGEVHPVAGVVDPFGNGVVALPLRAAAEVRSSVGPVAPLDDVRAAITEVLAGPEQVVYRAVYRWAVDVPGEEVLAPVGEWLPGDDPRIPEWLRPFRGPALVALEDGRYLAGVGLKRHDDAGQEIAVGTDEGARGRGLARRLVAQAARDLIAAGVVPTYMHAADNVASARVADAAGFPDRGWTALGLA